LNTEGTDPTDNAYPGAALDQPVGRTASLTECLAAAVEGIARAALPEVVLHEARRALLDHLAVAIAGGTHPIAQAVSALVTQQMPGKIATVLATGHCSSALGAALANGVAAHVLELDDLHQGGTIHAGAPVIAAALAAAEQADVSCGQLLAAIVAGYDVAIRLACAVNPGHYRFWHPTATCGVFGAATAAGIVLGLNAFQLVNALGTAGTFASGLWAFLDDGAQSKPLHAGKAAHDGVLAASLAQSGIRGARRILEGPRGFFAAMAEDVNPKFFAEDLGQRFMIVDNGYKRHACCGHTHTAIDAALMLRPQLAGRSIDRIEVETYRVALDITDCPEPTTEHEAQFSLQHAVAVALCDGQAGLAQFRPERIMAPEVAALRRCVVARADPAMTAAYPQTWPARVRIWLTDGAMLEAQVVVPKGMPGNPLSDDELRAKAGVLLTERLGSQAALLADMVLALERDQPVRAVMNMMRRMLRL